MSGTDLGVLESVVGARISALRCVFCGVWGLSVCLEALLGGLLGDC